MQWARSSSHVPIRSALVAAVAALVGGLLAALPAEGQVPAAASTTLLNALGQPVGTVHFQEVPDTSLVVVNAEITGGLAAAEAGEFHGFHVHANSDPSNGIGCVAPTFVSADGHYDPAGTAHGAHAGDLPVLYVTEDGTARSVFAVSTFGIDDIIGRAVIVHADADNYANVPDERDDGSGYRNADDPTDTSPVPNSATLATGDAGARLACGVITAGGTAPGDPALGDEAVGGVLLDTDGQVAGLAAFLALAGEGDGVLAAALTDLIGDPGFHGFHVHAGNRCQSSADTLDFTLAEGHLDPDGAGHGDHAGDLPVLAMNPESATTQTSDAGAAAGSVTDRLTIDQVKGRTVVVHADPDNYANIPDPGGQGTAGTGYLTDDGQPPPDAATVAAGDSGARLACAMIEGSVRLSGPDRFSTATAISQDTFPGAGQAGAVVLARAFVYADALAGAPLAEAEDGVTLLTERDRLTPTTEQELQRVLAKGETVYVLGGDAAIGQAVEDRVEQLGYDVRRLSGPTRVETALAVAVELDATHDRIIVSTGYNWPDAVASGAAGASDDAVVLYSVAGDPHPATTAYLAAHDAERVYAVGGPAARAHPGADVELVGATRVETAVAVADEFFPDPVFAGLSRDGLTTDPSDPFFADALTGGVHAGRLGGPVVLTDEQGLHPAVAEWACGEQDTLTRGYAYGGTLALSAATVEAFEDRANGTGCPAGTASAQPQGVGPPAAAFGSAGPFAGAG